MLFCFSQALQSEVQRNSQTHWEERDRLMRDKEAVIADVARLKEANKALQLEMQRNSQAYWEEKGHLLREKEAAFTEIGKLKDTNKVSQNCT